MPTNHLPRPRSSGRGRRRDPLVVWQNKNVGIDMEKFAAVVEKWLVRDMKADAASGRGGDDKPLPPLSPEYAKRKAKKGGAAQPDFKLTGKLLRALKPRARKRKAKQGLVTVRVTVTNARFRQLIGLAAKGRRLVDVSDRDIAEIAEAVSRANVLVMRSGRPEVA